MPEYHLYRVDSATGRMTGAGRFDAADDAAAIRKAENSRSIEAPIELWAGGRKVCRIGAGPDADAVRPVPYAWDRALLRSSEARLEESLSLLRRTTPSRFGGR